MNNITAVLSKESTPVAPAVNKSTPFAAIYDRFFPRIYNYVRYRVRDAKTADDIVAQVFERVLVKIGNYRAERGPFSAWLFGIARNKVNTHLRSQRRRRRLSFDELRMCFESLLT